MARKRAPGGGRKPKFGVAGRSVTVRMPEDVFRNLEAAVRRHRDPRRTLTDELIGRLRASIIRERELRRDPPLRGWCFLISQVAGYATFETPNWHMNPFWFRSFKLGVIALLNTLEPKGKIRRPKDPDPEMAIEKTPEAQAEVAVRIVLHQLHGGRSRQYSGYKSDMPADAVLDERIAAQLDDQAAAALADFEFDLDAYEQVRQHLQIKPIWRRVPDMEGD